MFLSRKNIKNINSFVSRGLYILMLATYIRHIWVFSILITLSGIVLYCSPSESQDDLEKFLKNFDLNLYTILANNPFLTFVLGDFNVKSNLWCNSDKTSYKGSKIEGITSQSGLQQLINEPTDHTRNSSSCNGLIFPSEKNLVMESGPHSSLHKNCHHQMIYATFNLKICYPPP